MNAGLDLDQIIAEKIMGWRRVRPDEPPKTGWRTETGWWVADQGKHGPNEMRFPQYSIDISAAWAVVDKLRSIGFYYYVGNLITTERCLGVTESNTAGFGRLHSPIKTTVGESAPHAICLAALDAFGYKDDPIDAKFP